MTSSEGGVNPLDIPVDVHYARMESWLDDRAPVLSKRAPDEFKFLQQSAPRLVRLAQIEIPALRKAVHRSRGLAADVRARQQSVRKRRERAIEERAAMLRTLGLEEPPAGSDVSHEGLVQHFSTAADAAADTCISELQSALADPVVKGALETMSRRDAAGAETTALVPFLAAGVAGRLNITARALAGNGGTVECEPVVLWLDEDDDEPAVADGVPMENIAATETAAVSNPLQDLRAPDGQPVALDIARASVSDEVQCMRGFWVERALSLAAGSADDANISHLWRVCEESLRQGDPVVPQDLRMPDAAAAQRARLELTVIQHLDALTLLLEQRSGAWELARLCGKDTAIDALVRKYHALTASSQSEQDLSEGNAATHEAEAEASQSRLDAALEETIALRDTCEAALRRIFVPREAFLVGDINKL